MYDPKRREFNDYNPMSELQNKRKDKAIELVSLRKMAREMGVRNNNLVRACLPKKFQVDLPKPTIQLLRGKAMSMWNFAEQPIPNHLPCGADDAFGERQDYARSHALAIWRSVGRFD